MKNVFVNIFTFLAECSKQSRTEKVCHPVGFAPKKVESTKPKQPRNPYSKAAFVWSSDDDDFV
jgi:hypothetical protein